jgi:DNA-binding NtrC family response regulator
MARPGAPALAFAARLRDNGPVTDAAARALDDRSPYAAAQAVLTTLARLSDEFADEDAVIEAVIEAQGPGADLYFEPIKRSSHSVFYHHLQELYEFGRRHVADDVRDDFCQECGRVFMDAAFPENLHALLQMALAQPGTFQATVIRMLQTQLYHYAGEKYVFEAAPAPDQVTITLRYRNPDDFRAYVSSFGLDAEQCFRNSFEFIGAAIERFTSKIIAGYQAARFEMTTGDFSGELRLPIGADDSFDYDTLIPTLLGHISDLKARQEEQRTDVQLESGLIIDSPLMRDKWKRIRRASRSDEIVLLRGESGTGKSFFARKIHDLSPRRDQPFVEVGLVADLGSDNMIQSHLFGHEKGAFTGADEQKKGLFSLADGGTIFLDEIGDASPELQAKLLRVLETRTFKRLGGIKDISVDVRIIAATNRDLEKMVADGSFRRDLYYRLNVIPVILPPLRERRDEIPALAEFLLARAQAHGRSERRALAPGLADQLATYDWPGNIRELDHALKHAAAMADTRVITADDLPDAVRGGLGRGRPAADAGRKTGDPALIDVTLLRHLIRTTPPLTDKETQDCPAHIDYAKRTWLAALIDECGGDLALIARYWDRSSEKTLRNLVRAYGLTEHLAAARARRST